TRAIASSAVENREGASRHDGTISCFAIRGDERNARRLASTTTAWPSGIHRCVDPADRFAWAIDNRRRRHVVGGRWAADRPGGVRRRARRGVAALHADDG